MLSNSLCQIVWPPGEALFLEVFFDWASEVQNLLHMYRLRFISVSYAKDPTIVEAKGTIRAYRSISLRFEIILTTKQWKKSHCELITR